MSVQSAPVSDRRSGTPSLRLRAFVRILRPTHWVKNVFVLAPVIFVPFAGVIAHLTEILLACVVFCMLSSAVYCVNDVIDAASDRRHPLKRRRPVASGDISGAEAVMVGLTLVLAAAIVTYQRLPLMVGLLGLAYLANNAAYGLLLKTRVIVDAVSIATGVVIRLLAGAAAVSVTPTSWLLVCGFSLALVLAFGKRRAELALPDAASFRHALQAYTPVNLDIAMSISAGLALTTYTLYTVAPETVEVHGTTNLIYTIPFAVYGIFRYIFKAQEGTGAGPVDILFRDPVFLLNAAAWVIAVLIVLAVG